MNPPPARPRRLWLLLLVVPLVLAVLAISLRSRSAHLITEIKGARTLEEQLIAFEHVRQFQGCGVRTFNAEGLEMKFPDLKLVDVHAVEITFPDGQRVHTMLERPGELGSLLGE